jgi:hypothetical protein
MSTLAEAITTAFADVPKPLGLRAIAPHVCDECNELANDFSPYDFRSLPASLVEAQFSSLPLLSSEALHHYLPAYMLHSLVCAPDSNVLDFTVFHLVPSEKSMTESPAYFRERFAAFSQDQRAAIAAFLTHVYRSKRFTGSEPSVEHARALWPDVA